MPVGKGVKRSSVKATALDVVKERISSLDAMQSTVMLLGGTASACGLVPPMTQLLAMFNGKSGADVWMGAGLALETHALSNFITNMFGKDEQQKETPPTEEMMKLLGFFCSGAVEACIMYALVTNPETFKALIKIPGQAMEGLGSVLPI